MSTPREVSPLAGVPPTLDLVQAAAQSKLEHTLFGVGDLVRIGRYVVIEHVGAGGFGDVYVAFDPKLDRKVALKLVRAPIRGGITRALREAQALAKVTHPNVVAVYDAGVLVLPHAGEQLYIVMEFVGGLTLAEWVAATPRAWRDVMNVFIAAGRGLAAVHDAGLVHHDFKPSNVLIGERTGTRNVNADRAPGPDRVRVADFGLASITEPTGPSDDASADAAVIEAVREDAFASRMTPESVVGTPVYMAPEQHAGHPTDARADQFAFAVALFEALYGTRPYDGETLAVLAQHKQSGRIVEAPHRGVPPRIRGVLRRALSPRPEDRHRDLDALLVALQQRSVRQRASIAVAAVLGIGTLVGFAVVRDRAEQAALADVELASRAARDAAALALFVYPLPDDELGTTAYRRVLELDAIDTEAAHSRAAELRAEFADTLTRLGDRYWSLEGGRAFALDYYVQALVFVPDHARALERVAVPPGRLLALEDRAARAAFTAAELQATAPLVALAQEDPQARVAAIRTLIERGDQPVSARGDLERLLASDRVAAKASSPAAAPVPSRPSPPVPVAQDLPMEPTTAPDAVIAPDAKSSPARDPIGVREALARGRELVAAGRWRDAERSFHRVIELDKRNVPALHALAGLYFELRSYRKARDFARRAVALAPGDARLRITYGDAAFKLLDYAEARAQYERARALGSDVADRRLATLDELTGNDDP